MSSSERATALTWEIDGENRILEASESWDRFAAENEAPELAIESIRHRSLFDFVTGEETRFLLAALIEASRKQRRRIQVELRCDSPSRFRQLELALGSSDGRRVTFESVTIEEGRRESGLLLARGAARSPEPLLRVCSWCCSVHLIDEWVEPEVAARSLGLFERSEMPRLTHGLCPSCDARIRRQIT